MTDTIVQNRQQLEERVSEIQGNRDLNDEAKRHMLEEAYSEAESRHGALVAEQEEARTREIAQRERDVFALSYPKHVGTDRDREAYRQSYRDAAFKVLDMEPAALERVLDRAERIGDSQLAQAVYHEAVERGLPLANRYRESRPDARQRWERYVAARGRRDSVEGLFATAYSSMGPERPEG